MRTTLTIEDDVLDKARKIAQKKKTSFRHVINEALRAGLDSVDLPPALKPYITKPHRMGLKPGLSLDNVQELLAQIEGEESR